MKVVDCIITKKLFLLINASQHLTGAKVFKLFIECLERKLKLPIIKKVFQKKNFLLVLFLLLAGCG